MLRWQGSKLWWGCPSRGLVRGNIWGAICPRKHVRGKCDGECPGELSQGMFGAICLREHVRGKCDGECPGKLSQRMFGAICLRDHVRGKCDRECRGELSQGMSGAICPRKHVRGKCDGECPRGIVIGNIWGNLSQGTCSGKMSRGMFGMGKCIRGMSWGMSRKLSGEWLTHTNSQTDSRFWPVLLHCISSTSSAKNWKKTSMKNTKKRF